MGKITASQSASSSYSRRNECRDTTGDDSTLYQSIPVGRYRAIQPYHESLHARKGKRGRLASVIREPIGQTLYTTFFKERIQSGKTNLWPPMKKRKLLTWKSDAKMVKVMTKEKEVELREDRSLFARMMMVYVTAVQRLTSRRRLDSTSSP